MVQLWLNLPARDKMTPARYQSITADDIPTVTLPDEAGTVRVIAGKYKDHQGRRPRSHQSTYGIPT
ncbi:Pirin-like protein [Advenella kashmirensis WT001]|uniref:Pirin-like protein n=1 Tax=Advenella kashmirensis (strain DSM 17095 / LMG 22695 / WT001) TaxID=1036672 RepID=I3UEW9_ADVKW|nr:Pirin-like protein [Advenella kashmirensis WT001]